MIYNRKSVIVITICILVLSFYVFVNDSKPTFSATGYSITNYQDAVVETAYQYYYRGRALQYDGTYLNYQIGNSRIPRSGAITIGKNGIKRLKDTTFYSPEEVTTQDIHYSVCSHFVTMVYAEAFNRGNNKYTIRDIDNNEGFDTTFLKNAESNNEKNIKNGKKGLYVTTKVEKLDGLQTMIKENKLLPGDILLRMGNGGSHAMLYVGNGKILHSAGNGAITIPGDSNKSYDGYITAAKKINDYNIPYGNYRFESKADIIETKSRVLNTRDDSLGTIQENCIDNSSADCFYNPIGISKEFYVIRIITSNNIKNFTLSDHSKNRIKAKGIVINKKLTIGTGENEKSIEKYHSVNLNEIINYVIKIENKSSNRYDKVIVTENIPEGTHLYSKSDGCSQVNDKNEIKCEYEVPENNKAFTKTFYIRVRVSNNRNDFNKIIESKNGKVEIARKYDENKYKSIYTMPTKNISIPLKRTLSNEDRSKLVANVYKNVNNDKTGPSNDFFNKMYELLGYANINLPRADKLFETMTYNNPSLLNMIKTNSNYEDFRTRTQTTDFSNIKLFSLDNIKNESYYKMFVPGLFGGIFTTSSNENSTTMDYSATYRNNTYHNETLLPGDVLYVYDHNASHDNMAYKGGYLKGVANAYLYLGNGNFATNSDGKLIIYDEFDKYENNKLYLYGADRVAQRVDLNSPLAHISMGTRLLTSLLGQDSYVVLRPSYAINDKVTSIEILKDYSYKNIYVQNKDNLDLSGGRLKITYGNNGYKVIRLDDKNITVSDFDNKKLGEQTLKINYKGDNYKGNPVYIKVKVNKQTDVIKNVSKISIKVKPKKLNYIQNKDNLDLSGGVLLITYSDNTKSEVDMKSKDVKTSGFDNKKIGNQSVEIDYLGKKITLSVNVIEEITKSVKKVEIVHMPKTFYAKSAEELDLTSGTIKVTYEDNTTDIVDMNSEYVEISDFDNNVVGKETIDLTYLGEKVSFEVDVKDISVESVRIFEESIETMNDGNEMDLSGGKIEVKYSDNSIEIVDLNSPNVKVIRNENSEGKLESFEIDYLDQIDTIKLETIEKQKQEQKQDNNDISNIETYKSNKLLTYKFLIIFLVVLGITSIIFMRKKKSNI